MKIIVIGGTGHIGRFLIPQLIEDGHEVTTVTTGRTPIPEGTVWNRVKFRDASSLKNEKSWLDFVSTDKTGVLIDILGNNLPELYRATKSKISHIIACGSVWMLGTPTTVPVPEITQGPCQFEGYQKRYHEILAVKETARKDGVSFTAILPPNICGPGKIPLDCRGGRSIEVHQAHQRGEPVQLPEGCNNLVGPCDASDVAQGFWRAVRKPEAAADEIFNVGAAYALTTTRFVEAYGEIYGIKIPVEQVTLNEFKTKVLPDPGDNYHFLAHMCPDIHKIREKLDYAPEYTPEETMERAVAWMCDEKLL
ncbi:MAG: NAD(P)-dependent oxidoreductase [Candidatus Omnitrophica bacterium]|nr:NAD(P)-dependent oxidoreductase [Candidatus Omnitrophota bacterium]